MNTCSDYQRSALCKTVRQTQGVQEALILNRRSFNESLDVEVRRQTSFDFSRVAGFWADILDQRTPLPIENLHGPYLAVDFAHSDLNI
jgi:hypothetical protein